MDFLSIRLEQTASYSKAVDHFPNLKLSCEFKPKKKGDMSKKIKTLLTQNMIKRIQTPSTGIGVSEVNISDFAVCMSCHFMFRDFGSK